MQCWCHGCSVYEDWLFWQLKWDTRRDALKVERGITATDRSGAKTSNRRRSREEADQYNEHCLYINLAYLFIASKHSAISLGYTAFFLCVTTAAYRENHQCTNQPSCTQCFFLGPPTQRQLHEFSSNSRYICRANDLLQHQSLHHDAPLAKEIAHQTEVHLRCAELE